MKHSQMLAALLFLTALHGAGVAVCSQTGSDETAKSPVGVAPKGDKPGLATSTLQPCTLARSVVKQQGLLDPRITMLPSGDAFAAANGDLKLVLACGLSSDEVYTYSRLLARSGIGLIAFKGDEAPDRVIRLVADRLGVPFRLADPDAADNAAQTYIFPAKSPDARDLRITVNVPGSVSSSPRRADPIDQAAGAGGIRELYLLAAARDPELGRSQVLVVGSKADTDVVRSAYHPRVVGSLGISQIDQTVLNYSPGPTQSSVFGYTYDVTASMPLLHLPTRHNISAAVATTRGEEAGVLAARQNLIVRVADAYFSILRAKTDEHIARDELDKLQQILEQARAFLKAGTGDIIAVYEAQARLDSVIADLSRAESLLHLSEQKLSSIVGSPVRTVPDYLQLRPTEAEPDDLDWWLGTMERQDPQIQQAREGLTQTLEQTEAARADRYPVIDASAGYDVSKGAAFLPDVETRQWHVGATATVTLYSGGESAARIRRAVANQDERRYLLEATLEQRRENLKQSFFNLRDNVSLIKALKQRELSSEMQLKAVKKGRSLGTRTAIDLLNAEQAYSIAKRDLRNALYDNVVRIIQLKAAAGILEEVDLAGA